MKVALAFITFALAVVQADVSPIPGTVPVEPTFQASDLVCNCEIGDTKILGEQQMKGTGEAVLQKRIVANLQVRDVYKRNNPHPSIIRLVGYEGQFQSGERALLFLKAAANSDYALTDESISVTPFSDLPNNLSGTGLAKLQTALAAVLKSSAGDDLVNAMKLLQGFQELSPDTIAKLIPLSSSKDARFAFAAFAVLLKNGGPEFISKLRLYLDNYHGDARPISLVSIGTELGQVNDVRALQDIEVLSNSQLFSVRLGAMYSLRKMRSPDSVDALIRRLDDPNSTIQYLAVITLAETFNKSDDYAPTMYLFDKSPQKYLTLWKSWWKERTRASSSSL